MVHQVALATLRYCARFCVLSHVCHCSCFWKACIVDRERQGFWCMEIIMYTDHYLFVTMHIVCIDFLPLLWNMNALLLLFCSIYPYLF